MKNTRYRKLKDYLVCDCTNWYPGATVERRFEYENFWKWIIHQHKVANVNNAIVRLLQTVSLARNYRDACETCNRYVRLLIPVTILCLKFFSCASTFGHLRFLLCHQYCIIQCVPLATEPGISLIILTPMKILQRNLNRGTVFV